MYKNIYTVATDSRARARIRISACKKRRVTKGEEQTKDIPFDIDFNNLSLKPTKKPFVVRSSTLNTLVSVRLKKKPFPREFRNLSRGCVERHRQTNTHAHACNAVLCI